MKYRYYTWCIVVQATCNFAARLRGIPSFFEFHDTHCTWAVKYGEWVSHANQLQWTSILGSLDLHLLCTSKNLFFTNLGVHFWVDQFFAEYSKCHTYTWFHSALWLVPPEQGARSWQLFPWMLPGSLSSPPIFLTREPGDNMRNLVPFWIAGKLYMMYSKWLQTTTNTLPSTYQQTNPA